MPLLCKIWQVFVTTISFMYNFIQKNWSFYCSHHLDQTKLDIHSIPKTQWTCSSCVRTWWTSGFVFSPILLLISNALFQTRWASSACWRRVLWILTMMKRGVINSDAYHFPPWQYTLTAFTKNNLPLSRLPARNCTMSTFWKVNATLASFLGPLIDINICSARK